ncbi:MAG TPA: hypothetical protein VL486_16255, partial [Verrucomicrobiae bacterium]|nr:hypothetical protein [Verrucomicrobiae bacterium]
MKTSFSCSGASEKRRHGSGRWFRASQKRGYTILLIFLSSTAVFADDLDFSTLKYLAVQKDGRKKPLDTVAIETVEKLT